MDIYRKAKPNTPSGTGNGAEATASAGTGTGAAAGSGMNTSIAPLITMIAVLVIILIFCFCGAPAVRDFCRKRVCCCCPEPDAENPGTSDNSSTTPTIILLPFGRMLVVDRSVFAEFEADQAGLDFMELSANLIRAHRHGGRQQYASTPSILDSEATSKVLSDPCTPVGMSPPAYEDICDLPPSYSELGLSVCVQSIKQSSSSTNNQQQQQQQQQHDAQVEADEPTTSSTGSYVVLRVSSDTDVHQGCYYEASKTRPITKQLSL